ncbi:hypothetical protein CkaCkLH20_10543 [Colletotrichum karsti]|uniref:Uncharacterized protein n=1 Tax=Colletotrichum karsti TaxID=1095194 RepID=A0A9P6I0S8_9PEZI|nr:uncharacterized protein CkaCkLH20_10543 [Colletotrichum karsti]KAF9871911.1 hypothetical protein CkaCkLH20_10543 [Colletotrichum karsti]
MFPAHVIGPNGIKRLERFDPGEELLLTPYPISDPYGVGKRSHHVYAVGPGSPEPASSTTSGDAEPPRKRSKPTTEYAAGTESGEVPDDDADFIARADPKTRVRLVIHKAIRLMNNVTGHRVIICRVEDPPTAFSAENGHARHLTDAKLVIVKIYGKSSLRCSPHGNTPDQANWYHDFTQEASVYQYLYDKKLTGHPHLAPQYYGTWALTNESDQGSPHSLGDK